MNEEDVFAAVMEIEHAGERAAYLDRVCVGDDDLRRNIEELVVAYNRDIIGIGLSFQLGLVVI